jgi:hypothetical protein
MLQKPTAPGSSNATKLLLWAFVGLLRVLV